MSIFAVVFLCGLICVGSGEAKRPSWKDCKVEQRYFYPKYYPVRNCVKKGFTRIPEDIFTFSNQYKDKYLFLADNPYYCDCNMKWFVRLLKSDDNNAFKVYERIDDRYFLRCEKPQSLRGKKIMLLTENQVCPAKKGAAVKSWEDCKTDAITQTVDCSNSKIESVPKDIFSTTFNYIKLGRNPYNCNCNMKWFVNMLKDKMQYGQTIKDVNNMKCAKPKKLANKIINYLSWNDVCPAKVYSGHCKAKQPCDNKTFTCVDTEFAHKCIDIDECAPNTTNECHPEATCNNRVGGYDCVCNEGYAGNGKHCTDIDDCPEVTCLGKHTHCENTLGDYSCVCNAGFWEHQGKHVCLDIDECNDKTDDCHQEGLCINTAGSYKCKCKEGYIEHDNGKLCEKRVFKSCSMRPSPCVNVNEKCIDISEDRSFKCVCRHGFARKSRLGGCDDINECTTRTPCSVNAKCKNTIGSYQCACKKGYSGNGKHCVDIDECAIDVHDCHRDAVCVNDDGGFKCRCKPGFKQLKDGRLCLKEENESSVSVTTIIVIASVVSLLIFLVTIGYFAHSYKKKNHSKTRQKGSTFAGQPKNNLMFFFDDASDPGVSHILPSASAVTEWSEDEETREDYYDYDD